MTTDARALFDATISEAAFQDAVIELAQRLGWLCYHTHDSRRSAPGFPDVVLVRDRVLFAELKTRRGRVSPWQREWITALRAAGCECSVWRPADWDALTEVLR